MGPSAARRGGALPGLRARAQRLVAGPAGTSSGWPEGGITRRVQWTIPFVCLLLYMAVVHSGRLRVGQEALVLGLLLVPTLAGGIRVPAPLIWMGALVGWCFVTAALSPFGGQSMDASYEFMKVWLIAFLAANAIRTREQLRAFVVIWLGLYALFPVRGTLMNYLAGVSEFGRYKWNFIFENPNDLATFTLLQIALCLALLQVERQRWVRTCAILGIGALAFVLVITQSRGGMLALGTLVLVTMLRQKKRARNLALFGLAGLLVMATAPEKVFSRLGGLTALMGGTEALKEVDKEQSAASRFAIWRVASHITKQSPVNGVGWGTYADAHLAYQGEVPDIPRTARGRRDAHGTYMRLAAETGFVGLALFLGVILSSRRAASRALKTIRAHYPGIDGFLLALLVGQLAYLQAAIFGSYAHLPFLYLFTVLIVVTSTLYGRPPAALPAAPAGAPAPRAFAAPAPAPARGRRGGLAVGTWR